MDENKHKIEFSCRVEEYGGNKKLIPNDYWWEGETTDWCVHGMKLRWSCDFCEEYFYPEENE